MTNCPFTRGDYRDIQSVNLLADMQKKPFGAFLSKFTEKYLQRYARDNARTPMQWNTAKNAGFTQGTPWMKINGNYREINAQSQIQNPDSVFCFYQKALDLRKQYADIVRDGEFSPIDKRNKHVLAFTRQLNGKYLLAVCSLSPKSAKCKIPAYLCTGQATLLLRNTKQPIALTETVYLPPCTCALWEISPEKSK